MTGKLYIDGLDAYSTYGIGVTKTSGEHDWPKRKKSIEHNWPDEHGKDIDASKHYYESRTITLELFLSGSNSTTYQANLKSFFAAMRAPNLRLIKFGSANPKVYMVYMENDINLNRKNSLLGSNVVATFTLKLTEPNPINRQFTCPGGVTAQFTLTTSKVLTIFWGDNTMTTITGTAAVKSKALSAGTKYVTLAGDIDTISGLSLVNLTEI